MCCLAVISLGASLAYLRTEERPPATAHALDHDWSTTSELGVRPGVDVAPAARPPVCAICGQVEAVKPLPFAERLAGRKPLFSVTVRMEDGRTLAVQVEKPPTVGTQVTLERGVLRVAHA